VKTKAGQELGVTTNTDIRGIQDLLLAVKLLLKH